MNYKLEIDQDTWLDVSNIADETFAPLKGFVNEVDYRSIVENMKLISGDVWSIPVTLDVQEDVAKKLEAGDELGLFAGDNGHVADVLVGDVYRVNLENDLAKVFGTTDVKHPGVNKEKNRSVFRVGGKVTCHKAPESLFPELSFSPAKTKAMFKEMGWKTVVGFQTRNPPHRAHEYLQRVALETVDGLFLQPLIGWKKGDDFSPYAVVEAYKQQVKKFYPKERVVLGALSTQMRYAGPREAVFHAIIRRNHGCTHFVVGRDHAGVGGFYGKYAAHELCKTITGLGIQFLMLCGPYYCEHCGGIATEKTCPHGIDEKFEVSGTKMRKMLSEGERPPKEFMRLEVSDVLIELAKQNKLFCGDL